ncbi:hypothetical protein Ddye_018230 [Dipteronia dyeriana]|uniref:Uncharacterized protein n=1 Tax=Dipteronia dyeriana TaxID=168575 RepID=A0AAD9UA57_9ROSI|nr:hypothetical protein Ddye_018230 [Dipteronia dyeriana]
MGKNEHQSRSELSIFGNDQENNLEEVLEPAPECCIYRVPQYLRKINEEAYTPKLISIGPLHYGRNELMGMERQKTRLLSKFRDRVGAQKLEEFKTCIQNQEQHIRSHYSVTSNLQSSKYVAMILRDAVSIIELFLRKYNNTKDFLLEVPLTIRITVDLLLLENQVPYCVLNYLYTIAFPERNPPFSSLPHNFFSFIINIFDNRQLNISADRQPQVKHFTDFLRCALVRNVQPALQSNRESILDLPNATKLKGSGLKFRGIKEKCFLDISLVKREHGKWLSWYQVNEVQIPHIKIYDETEGIFRNIIALEMFHYSTQTYITNYAVMMDYLIDTAKDVDLLVEKEIIVNCVGDNEAVAKMFNSLCSNVPATGSRYYDTVEKMKAHYKYPLNHLKATLKSVYFGNLWTGTATVAAALLLILTAIQTICSILQVNEIFKHNGN